MVMSWAMTSAVSTFPYYNSTFQAREMAATSALVRQVIRGGEVRSLERPGGGQEMEGRSEPTSDKLIRPAWRTGGLTLSRK